MSGELKPGYKQTEVGVIPEDWEVVSIGSLASFTSGQGISVAALRPQSPDTPVPVYGGNGIAGHTARPLVHEPVVVVGRVGQKCGEVYLTQGPAWITDNALYPRTIFRTVEMRFLALAMKAAGLNDVKNRNDLPLITQSILHSVRISFPPTLTEQHAIAEALSDADALIESLEQLVAKKRLVKQGAMQELLTGKRRLPEFSGEWEVKRIAEIATPSSEINTMGETLPVLTCSKHLGFVDSLGYFKNQVFSKDTRTYKVIRRGQIGYPANHIGEGSIGLQNLYQVALVSPIYVVFSVNEGVDSYFLHRALKLDSYRQKFKTSTTSSVDRRGSLRWPVFSEITVGIPSLAEQTAIAAILSDMDAEIAALEGKLVKARQVKQGMMQELLTGRIRLI